MMADEKLIPLFVVLPAGTEVSPEKLAGTRDHLRGLGYDLQMLLPEGSTLHTMPGPYSFAEQLGTYRHEYTFASLGEMAEFLEHHRLGPYQSDGTVAPNQVVGNV